MSAPPTDRHTQLRHLLVAAAHAHHAVYGGPSDRWARWYAEWVYGQLLDIVQSSPSVDELEGWLIEADARYTSENPEGSWPGHYATWILERDEDAGR